MARDGRFGEIGEMFAPELRAAVSDQALQLAWTIEMGKRGPVSAVEEPVGEPVDAGRVRVSVPVVCERDGFTVVMSVDDAGALHGLQFVLATTATWAPPDYAVPQLFVEQDITVGSGPLAVPGTLSLPLGAEPRPGVVLLSGGGPFDRDETIGPNKPLKDLAWGLASRGAATLRFDKVTHTHSQVTSAPDFTMASEYVPHAVAAVRALQNQPGVDPTRVYILGHSMGGKVAPRVAAAEPSVAGLVILAGDTQPMHRAAVRVARYLASLTPGPPADALVKGIMEQVAMVDSPDLSPSTPAKALPFELPGSYWLDMRAYDPVAAAAALDKPMFIGQGGRDYQVTVADDLSGWRDGLAHRPDVTIRVYDADNHLFFPGVGPSTPAEYEPAQHVDPAVVGDIAEWLALRGGAALSV
ncbi:alpha/beta hydrolase family protein [Nonomuraea sp. MTCD27]|uniref:alpha/beta hydrolase family protein n=1 Tax=Nonomuraea sp. MTCD27 TaxID=1676747 RepID=UPI0035C014B7